MTEQETIAAVATYRAHLAATVTEITARDNGCRAIAEGAVLDALEAGNTAAAIAWAILALLRRP